MPWSRVRNPETHRSHRTGAPPAIVIGAGPRQIGNLALSTRLLRATATVGGLTLLSRILGFVRDQIIAREFGADAATDAFFVAFKIPNLLRRLFAEGTFAQAFVPVLADYKVQGLDRDTRRFLDRSTGSLGLILTALAGLGILAAPLLILIFAPGFKAKPVELTLSVEMLRITLPYLVCICLTALAGAILNTFGHFAIPAVTPVLLNLAMIGVIYGLAPALDRPVLALAYGVLLAGFLQLGLQLPALQLRGLLPRPRLGLSDPGVRRVLRLMGPAVLAASVGQLNSLINTLIASFLDAGSLSWLYYSDRLLEFPLGIFGIAIGTVILPHLSQQHAARRVGEFSRSLDWALRWVFLIGLPATLGLLLLAEPLMLTLFQYQRFSLHDAAMAARSLSAFALGLLGFIAIKVLLPGFSARQDLATPARYSIYGVGINLLLSLILVFALAPAGWAHAALALAASLAALSNAGLLLQRLLRDGIYRPEPGWGLLTLRLALANGALIAVLAAAPARLDWQHWTAEERILHLGAWIGLGAAAYVCVLLLGGLRPRHLLFAESA